MQTCIFCKIVRGEAPAHRVYEDNRVIVFLDIFPVSEGHTLVVTKQHYSDLFEADPESLQAVATVAKKVAHALREVVRPAGLMVFQLNGSAAGQTVFHYHMHLMPRAEGEPLRLHARKPGDPKQLANLAARLRAALENR
jgi:histidine triad (HIT) family protein